MTSVSASQPPTQPRAVQPPAASRRPSDVDVNGPGQNQILSVSWNQDSACFTAAMSSGFRIYNCEPFKETIRRDLKGGGFAIVEMLYRSNLMALVGGVDNKHYPPNRVMIWDDRQGRCIGEFTFRSHVRGVRLRSDLVVVAVEHKIYVYNFVDLGLLHQFETCYNPKGLCCISSSTDTPVLVLPGLQKGQVQIQNFGQKIKSFTAHDTELACLGLTSDGAILATASIKGTLIRLFNTMDGTQLQEVRRGTERAEIYSIAFSQNSQWLAVSSDKGTVHLFGLKIKKLQEDPSYGTSESQGPGIAQYNAKKAGSNHFSISFIRGALPKYFSSERSFAQFRLPEVERYIVTFGSHNTIMILGTNGRFYRCSFDPKNGEMKQKERIQFPEPDKY